MPTLENFSRVGGQWLKSACSYRAPLLLVFENFEKHTFGTQKNLKKLWPGKNLEKKYFVFWEIQKREIYDRNGTLFILYTVKGLFDILDATNITHNCFYLVQS